MGIKKDLTGMRFNRLVVIKEDGRGSYGQVLWLCQCDCGKTTRSNTYCLTHGRANSCGCYRYERAAESTRTHGLSRKHKKVYMAWKDMMKRCYDQNNDRYKDYGGRGITVCEKWHDINNFFMDMKDGCAPGLSLERADNNLGYSKENCYWATPKQQGYNRRTTKQHTLNGITKSQKDWATTLKISEAAVRGRIKAGMTPEQALTARYNPGKRSYTFIDVKDLEIK